MELRRRLVLGALALAASGLACAGAIGLGDFVIVGDTSDAGADAEAGVAAEGGTVACTMATDCPAPADDCLLATCNGGTCAVTIVASTACTPASGGCASAEDCPPSVTACKVNTCTSNACGTTNASASLACNDNGGRLCDANGTCVACLAPTDCPAQTTVCKINACQANACAVTFAAQNTSCTDNGGSVCDGSGSCVAPHCTNGVKDDEETDVDCGGPCGATCKDTNPQQRCLVAGDCISGVCNDPPVGLLCQPPTCIDGVRNGNETDVDCGGATFNGKAACLACADTKHCTNNSDCVHAICFGANPGTCISCADGVKDGNETATDCGGASCDVLGNTCATGQACTVGADCQTGYCPNATCQVVPPCGPDSAAGDARCPRGDWCDGLSGGTCQVPQPKGSLCTRDAQCQNTCKLAAKVCS